MAARVSQGAELQNPKHTSAYPDPKIGAAGYNHLPRGVVFFDDLRCLGTRDFAHIKSIFTIACELFFPFLSHS